MKSQNFHFLRPNFEITVSGELLFWLIWNLKETPQLDWADLGNLPYDLNHGIGLEFLNTKVWNILIVGMGGQLDRKWKGCELIFQDHNRDLSVKWQGCVGVRESAEDDSISVSVPSNHLVSLLAMCRSRAIDWCRSNVNTPNPDGTKWKNTAIY